MAAEKKLRRDVRLRLKQAIERERKWNDAYEKAQERVRRSRTEATLNRYLDQAVKAEKYRRKAAKEIAELRPHVARLAEAGRIASRIATTYRARQNATTPVSATVAKKEKRLQEERRRRLLQANVDADPRTAMGNREMDVVGLGASLRASINHFNSCFRRRDDRSNSRIMAWSKFDELHGMMVDVIFWQRRYTDLVPLHGDVEGIGYMFRRALDMTAAWFGITPDDERGRVARRAIERRFQEAGASSQ
jgi:hypothetical protein